MECGRRFPATDTSLVAVRAFVRRSCLEIGLDGLNVDAVVFVANKLAIGAIAYETGEFRVDVIGLSDVVRVEVWRPTQHPEEASADPFGEPPRVRGSGLHVIEGLVRGWGVVPIGGGGTIVWAEVPILLGAQAQPTGV